MPRRTAWKKQSRREVFSVRASTPQFKAPAIFLATTEAMRNFATSSTAQKRDFLIQNLPASTSVLQKITSEKGVPKESLRDPKVAIGAINDFTPAHVVSFTKMVARSILLKEVTGQTPYFIKFFSNYLQSRNIPVDKKVLADVIPIFFLTNPKSVVGGKINFAEFERTYIPKNKEARAEKITVAQKANKLINAEFRGVRLTKRQRVVMRKWLAERITSRLKRHFEDYSASRINKNQLIDLSIKVFVDAQNDLRVQFKSFLPREKTVVNPAQPTQAKKLGERNGRIAAYEAEERQDHIRSRELNAARDVAEVHHTPFNPAKHCLVELKKENETAGKKFEQLLSSGAINQDSLTRLFISGSLSRRVFLAALEDTSFEKEFGLKEANSLAKGIAFMGSRGKLISSAKRAFQSRNADKLFKFLEGASLIEIHSGGKVAYLRRINQSAKASAYD